MAVYGQGDARWIVEERADGQNVNGWHWKEIDAMDWSKKQLQEMFEGLVLVDKDGMALRLEGLDRCKGEACINNRKNKLIPVYELDLSFAFAGEVRDGEGAVVGASKGKVHLPYVSDENHDEEPEVRFAPDSDSPASSRLKEAFQSSGKKVLLERLGKFVAALRSGGPALASKGGEAAAASSGAAAAAAVEKVKLTSAPPEPSTSAPAKPSSSSGRSQRALELKEKFFARPLDIWECFTLEPKIRAFTQSPTEVDPQVGGRFSWFSGTITGTFTELEPHSRIVMTWRFSSWEDGVESKVVLTLDAPEPGTTVLRLAHTGIPEEDKFGQAVLDNVEKGWKGQIINRVRQVFGYGVGL